MLTLGVKSNPARAWHGHGHLRAGDEPPRYKGGKGERPAVKGLKESDMVSSPSTSAGPFDPKTG
jgi:hypothetical protein